MLEAPTLDQSKPEDEVMPDFFTQTEHEAEVMNQKHIENSVAEREATEYWDPNRSKEIPDTEPATDEYFWDRPRDTRPSEPVETEGDFFTQTEHEAEVMNQADIEKSVEEERANQYFLVDTPTDKVMAAMRDRAHELQVRSNEHFHDK